MCCRKSLAILLPDLKGNRGEGVEKGFEKDKSGKGLELSPHDFSLVVIFKTVCSTFKSSILRKLVQHAKICIK